MRWTSRASRRQRRGLPAPLDGTAEVARRALPLVQELKVHAIDAPEWRAGAEAMRSAVLDVLRAAAADCNCHPDYHALGVHAPNHIPRGADR